MLHAIDNRIQFGVNFPCGCTCNVVLIFVYILTFIFPNTKMSERRGMKALELWCKKITDGYAGVKVENMTTSWRDGLAFCALIHHFRPDLIDFQSLEKGDVYRNNELAFRTAERHLGIPALLDAEDMALYEVPDRLSILTYLSQFYQVFASQGNSPVKRSPEPADRSLVLGSTVQTPPPKDLGCAIRRKEPCFKCGLPVFLAQRLIVENRLHHRTCFRCARCNAQLSLANYYETVDGVYCCETCPDEEKVAVVNNNAKNSINNMAGGETLDDNLTINSNNKKDNISINNSSKNYDQFTTTAIDKTEELVSSRRESLVGVRKMMFENIANNKSSTSSQSKLENSSALISPKIVEESKLTDDDKVVIIKAKKGSLCDNDKFKNSDDSDINVKNNISDSDSKSRSRRNSCSISSDNVDLVVDFIDNKDSDNEPIDPDCKNVNIEETTQVTKVLSDINDKNNFKDVSYVDENYDNISEDVVNNDKAQIIDDNLPSVSNVIPSIVIVDDKSTIVESTNDEISNDTYVEMKSVCNDDIDEPIYEEIKENRSSIKSNVSMDTEDVKINNDKIDTDSINTDKDDKEIISENTEILEEIQDKLNEVKLETDNENISENDENKSENDNQIDIPAIVTDKNNSLEITDKEQLKDDENNYPEELNPFGDEDEGEDDKINQTSSTNPFESDMDDDDEDVKQSVPKPAARTVRKESESDRLNPFWSGSDEDNDDENSALMSAPVPLPRKLKTPQLSPTPIPRSSRHKVTSSIGSASSSGIFSESPSPRKKKLPAPAPPSQNSTLRARKPRPPPPPPPPSASQTSRCTTPSIASDAISIERSPPSTPKLREILSEGEFDKQQLINEVAECIKNKSTFGQWKRKKGQAPPPPIPQRRTVKPMPLKQVHQELADIEVKQQELERQGVSLEQTIRDKFDQEESMTPFVEELVLQLFELVNEKNELFRRQAELMYLRRQHNLEEEQADLEYQIRCLMLCPEHNKTDSDKEREEELIKRLVEVVERRNSIIQCLDMDRLREAEEDKSVSAQLGSFSAAIGSEIDLTNLDKKDKKSKKDKKKQKDSAQSSNSNSSLDRDLNNTEKLLKHKKLKKKWFTLSHSKKP